MRARPAKAALYAVLLGFAAVVGRRGRGNRTRGEPAPAPAGLVEPTVQVGATGRGRRLSRKRLGLALLVAAPLLAGAASVWWARGQSWGNAAFVAVGVVLAGLAFWKLTRWQAEAAQGQTTDKSPFELENEARRTLAEALGGLFLVVGLAVTW